MGLGDVKLGEVGLGDVGCKDVGTQERQHLVTRGPFLKAPGNYRAR